MTTKTRLGKSATEDLATPQVSIPLTMIRGALFSVAEKGERALKKQIDVENGPLGLRVEYTGPHLNQEHFKAWQAAVHLGKEQGGLQGDQFVVPVTALMRAMGQSYRDHDQRLRAWRLLGDLTEANVDLQSFRSKYKAPLVFSVLHEEASGKMAIRLNPDLAQLLSDEVLQNDMLRVLGFGRNQIAIWLHNYYASHKVPPAIAVKDLQRLCGTKLNLPMFRQRLRKALDRLKTGVRPLVLSWSIDAADVVRVEKVPTQVKLLPADVKAKHDAGKRHGDMVAQARAARARVVL